MRGLRASNASAWQGPCCVLVSPLSLSDRVRPLPWLYEGCPPEAWDRLAAWL